MPGVIEDLPYAERVTRLELIARELVTILNAAGGHMNVLDAMRKAAEKFKTMVSQIRYGLDYAINHRMVALAGSTLAIA